MFVWLSRILSASIFLFTIVFSIPLAFDVGGRTCGLGFSLALALFYLVHSTLSILVAKRTRFTAALLGFLSASQWIIIPTLMIWSLNRFSIDANSTTWLERTFHLKRQTNVSVGQWLFGHQGLVERLSIQNWDRLLRWTAPVFQLVEGFCSLLVIQAAGQITRHVVNGEGGDNWMVLRPSLVQQFPHT